MRSVLICGLSLRTSESHCTTLLLLAIKMQLKLSQSCPCKTIEQVKLAIRTAHQVEFNTAQAARIILFSPPALLRRGAWRLEEAPIKPVKLKV